MENTSEEQMLPPAKDVLTAASEKLVEHFLSGFHKSMALPLFYSYF
jgi:hypothetical protein